MAAMISLGEEIALCSWAAETTTEEEDVPFESATADFLGLSSSRLAELQKQAAELHIDPRFFN